MSKRIIWSIIGLMSLSVIGLIIIQCYWIANAYKLKQQQFNQNVSEALNKIVEKVEREESYDVLVQRMVNRKSVFTKCEIKDLKRHKDKLRCLLEQHHLDLSNFAPHGNISISDFFGMPEKTELLAGIDMGKVQHISELSPELVANEFDITLQNKIKRKYGLISDVVLEVSVDSKPIEDRIDPVELENIVKATLNDEGLNIPFEYGIYNTSNKKLVASRARCNAELLQTPYRATLFPNDLISTTGHLLLFFPGKDNHLLKQMWMMLSGSMILILFIVFCFGYTVNTVFRQKKLSDMKTDFINNMTHEFKTPIATISLAGEALGENSIIVDQGKRSRFIGVIREENERLRKQVEKVLQLAKMDKGDLNLQLGTVDIHRVVEDTIQSLNLQVEEKRGKITTNFEAENPIITADEVHLTNIIFNLLDNANKYSPENPEINVTTRNTKGGISVSISDRGIGMTKDTVKRIFDKFYRKSTGNQHDVKGFGLGLHYVKTMVEAHGGIIKVKSELDNGSTFEIFFPFSNNHLS